MKSQQTNERGKQTRNIKIENNNNNIWIRMGGNNNNNKQQTNINTKT